MANKEIAVLVDSGTDVPQEVMDKYGVFMIPLQIIYKEKTYTDKIDITPQQVYDRLHEEVPSTSLPEGRAIAAIFEQIKEQGYTKVVAVTISSGLSGTHNVLRLLGEEQKDLEVYVLDTKSVGIGAGLQAITTAELVDQGYSWEELIPILERKVKESSVYFNVATLEYLQKGGRIGLVASIVGTALRLNPTISCNEEGIYYTVAKSRGRKKSIEKMVKIVKEFVGDHSKVRLAVAHGDALEEGQKLRDELKKVFPQVEEILFGMISPALVVHTGPGLLGMAVQLLD
ncbi:DegV family protein [Enterococcus olivae]